MNLNN